MVDVSGIIISERAIIIDKENNKYKIIKKDKNLYAKSMFNDSGCGEYILYQERIFRNMFKVISN